MKWMLLYIVMVCTVQVSKDLYAVDVNGDTALHWAAYKGHELLVEILMEYLPNALEMEDQFGQVSNCIQIPRLCLPIVSNA